MTDPNARPPAPRNVNAFHAMLRDAIDVYWDDPRWLPEMEQFDILGHRVYRSDESPESGFQLVSGDDVLASRAWRDRTTIQKIHREDVTDRFISQGDNERREWIFQVRKTPISNPNTQLMRKGQLSLAKVEIQKPGDTTLYEAQVKSVNPDTGDVVLDNRRYLDLKTDKTVDPVLPDLDEGDRVFCTYSHSKNLIQLAYNRPYYYRVTTMAIRKTDGVIVESDFRYTHVANSLQLENEDFYWRRANEYNQWLLEVSGEENLFFLRKRSGIKCKSCYDETHGRARYDCPVCYGTGFEGGYEGPFEAWCTPFEATKNMSEQEQGLMVDISYELTILDPFILSPMDFFVRKDGQRFTVNGVTPYGARGSIRVQSATAGRMPESDYLHNFPVRSHATSLSAAQELDKGRQPDPENKHLLTSSPRESDATENKGRSIIFANIQQERL